MRLVRSGLTLKLGERSMDAEKPTGEDIAISRDRLADLLNEDLVDRI
jgi:hypothetical protein